MNLKKALKFIKTQQQSDGSFLSFSSNQKNNFNHAKKYNSVFPTSLILFCLNSVDNSTEIKKKAVDFLLSQKSDHWSFNYWTRHAPENKVLPYPDDLDDTFCALSAIYQYQPQLIDGSAIAQIVTLLTTVEKKEGGPYSTWLVPKTSDPIWQDIDLAVNSNIGYFLSLQEVDLESINHLIKSAINQNHITSPYYPSIYPLVYFISRFYKSEKLINIILSKKKSNHWGNPLNTALAISSLINLKIDPKILLPSINYLIKNQQKNGSWKVSAFCIDPAINRQTYYAGSPALTTAFCFEALSKYFSLTSTKLSPLKDKTGDQIHQEILQIAQQKTKFIAQIPSKNLKKEITLLPYYFYKSLGNTGKKVSKNLLIQSGLANLYGWVAYTIYDDFLDGDGQKNLLSLANICLRELTCIYHHILPKTNFAEVFNQTMDNIDKANQWEITNCYNFKKLPDYKKYSQLAQKSLGHALGPIAILYSFGLDKNSLEVKNVWNFFKNYLIARQLNDDAHDWEDDLKKGFINPVSVEILKKANNKKNFQKIFWEEILPQISNIILENIAKAKKNITKTNLITKPEIIFSLLKNVEYSAQKAIHEQTETRKFIREYQGK